MRVLLEGDFEDHDGLVTETSEEEAETLASVLELLLSAEQSTALRRGTHSDYLWGPLGDGLPEGFGTLDASRPWLLYWILHSLDLLGQSLSRTLVARCVPLSHLPNVPLQGQAMLYM
jgi:protein farnesyltransferase subunit beta